MRKHAKDQEMIRCFLYFSFRKFSGHILYCRNLSKIMDIIRVYERLSIGMFSAITFS